MSRSGQFVSLEFFPPKERVEWPAFFKVAERLREVDPLFVSVTYGAGGGTQEHTLDIVRHLKKEVGVEPMAHLTCVGACGEGIRGFLDSLAEEGIQNVLALRGDPPKDVSDSNPWSDFRYASDLVTFIRDSHPGFCVGVAGYPEKHPEAVSVDDDIEYLRLKLDQGASFAVTQLFFDNSYYWSFMDLAAKRGIDKPIIPGILPIFNLKIIQRILSLCGATMPGAFMRELEEAQAKGGNAAVQEAGIEHARRQIQELLDRGVPGVHLFTLNKDDACLDLISRLKFR
jgi:methylenetetrahydrofolate reductase (NADPH)